MGYNSRVYGTWSITPPLTARELRNMPELECVRVRVEESQRDTDEGVLTVQQGTEVENAIGGWAKYYDLAAHLSVLLAAIPLDHAITGEFVRAGEDPGDIERYFVDAEARAVRIEKARLSWPDGSPVEIP